LTIETRKGRKTVAGAIEIMTDTEKAEYESIIRLLTAKVEELLAANERLSSELTAHQTLRAIYSDSNQPATVRVKAATAALNVETPRLEPQPAPLDLVAEPVEPLAVVVERQRRRADEMLREMADAMQREMRVLPKPGSNGSGDST
jgi:hypothetical protein